MPEGHTIHRLARDLAEDLAGERVGVTSPNGRFTQASLLDGEVVTGATALGKHLLIDFGERHIHVHLGRFGKLRRTDGDSPPKPTARLRIQSPDSTWQMTGAIQCDLVEQSELDALTSRIGADPLASTPRSPLAWERFHASKRSVGAVLLDQTVLAGIGNIYRAEILFMLAIDPSTPASDIDKATFEKIWRLARKLLKQGVETNRIITVAGATERTPRRNALHVYKRKTCRVCGTAIATTTSAARTLYYCPVCQASRAPESTRSTTRARGPATAPAPRRASARRKRPSRRRTSTSAPSR